MAKLEIEFMEQKAWVLVQNYHASILKESLDIEQYVQVESEKDPHFYNWLLGVDTPKKQDQLNELSDIDKGVFLLYIQKMCVDQNRNVND